MLDKLSRKILKYMQTNTSTPCERFYDFENDLSVISAAVSSDKETVRIAVRYLEENGYIKFIRLPDGRATRFHLDHKGLHEKEFRRQEFIRYLEDKWIDLFALAVSFAALILSIISLWPQQ